MEKRWFGFALVVAVALISIGCGKPMRSDDTAMQSEELPIGLQPGARPASDGKDEFQIFVDRYGPPDRDDSTQYDSPRPPLVTRIIEYQPEGIKIAFYPISTVGQASPYAGWKVLGYIDTRSNSKIDAEEAAIGLQDRLKRRR